MLEQVQRGAYEISDRGNSILSSPNIIALTPNDLIGYKKSDIFKKLEKADQSQPEFIYYEKLNPEEQLISSYQQMKNTLLDELLEK